MHVVEWKSAIRTDLGLKQSPIPERQVMPIMQGTFQPVEKLTVSFTLLVVKRANRPHIPIHKTQVTEILAQSQCMRGNRASIRQSATRRNIRRGDIARGVSGESISVCMVNLCAERNQRTRHQQKTYYAGTIFHGIRWNPFNPSSHNLPSTTYKQRSRSRVTFVIFPATPRLIPSKRRKRFILSRAARGTFVAADFETLSTFLPGKACLYLDSRDR